MEPAKKAATLGRTIVQHLVLAALLLAAALVLVRWGDIGAKMFDSITLGYVSLGLGAAGKSAYEAAKTGRGAKSDPPAGP